MKKKKIGLILTYIAIIVIVLLVLQLAGIVPFPSFIKNKGISGDDSVKILNDYQIKLYVLGDEIKYPGELNVSYLAAANFSALSEEDPSRTVLIINDLSGAVGMSADDITLVRSLIYDKHINVMYFGDKYLSEWDDKDIPVKAQVDGEGAVSYFNVSGSVLRGTGFWTSVEDEMLKENKELLGLIITSQIEDYIRKVF